MRKKIGPIVGWAVTLAILVYLFRTVHFAEIRAALRSATWWTVPANALLIVAVYLADSFAIKKTFGWFVAPLSYREVLIVRGATYLLALVNYTVGQGAIVYFVNRSRGVPVLRGTAAVLLVMGVNVLMLLVLASIGLVVGSDIPATLRLIVYAAYAGLAVYIIAVAIKPAWLVRRPIFDVLLNAGIGGHLRAMAVRLPHILTLIALTWTSLAAFGVVVPFAKALLFLPIVYFVAVLPISFQGLGTSQAMMIHFFSGYAVGGAAQGAAKVLTGSLVSQGIAFVIQLSLGLVCMRSQLGRTLSAAQQATPAGKDGDGP